MLWKMYRETRALTTTESKYCDGCALMECGGRINAFTGVVADCKELGIWRIVEGGYNRKVI